MKKWLAFVLFVSVLALSSCNWEGKSDLKEANKNVLLEEVTQDVLLFSQSDTILEHSEVLDVLDKRKNIISVCESLNINQYKRVGNLKYIVLKTTNGLFWVLFDESDEQATMNQIKFSPIANKKYVDGLKTGMTLNDALTADPDGQYDFLQHSWTNYQRISYHYFEDGVCYCIRYDDNVIAEIVNFTF